MLTFKPIWILSRSESCRTSDAVIVQSPALDDHFSRLISHLWRGESWGYLWAHPDKVSHWLEVGTTITIPNGTERNGYFGLHPIDNEKRANERSTINEITAINCLFAEFDVKSSATGKCGSAHWHITDTPIGDHPVRRRVSLLLAIASNLYDSQRRRSRIRPTIPGRLGQIRGQR